MRVEKETSAAVTANHKRERMELLQSVDHFKGVEGDGAETHAADSSIA